MPLAVSTQDQQQAVMIGVISGSAPAIADMVWLVCFAAFGVSKQEVDNHSKSLPIADGNFNSVPNDDN
jgi:hypothetical protein